MKVAYVLNQNQSVTEELLSEMKKVRDYYRGTDDWIDFNHSWQSSINYIDKLKVSGKIHKVKVSSDKYKYRDTLNVSSKIHMVKESLSRTLPADQMDSGTLLDFVEHLVLNN
ncbi:Hypothetical predicted protein [Mytilus galloprovincialis]|uniref:Uncharacterized protein n=1 Tax=Mytilus galloprovincialis TaxID=29158 RepID=A0A8B6FT22_MYTGA|nr:Hypothetical predicted protein [Mytilus galloprovincialis]